MEESEALVLDVTDGDQTDIVIPVIGQNYIEGYVRLPDGEPAPEGGLSVSVGRAIVEIPQGEMSLVQSSEAAGLRGGWVGGWWVE